MKRHTQSSKHQPLVDDTKFLQANPSMHVSENQMVLKLVSPKNTVKGNADNNSDESLQNNIPINTHSITSREN